MFSKKININYGLFQPGLINLINSLSKEIPELATYEVDTRYQKEMSESAIYTGFIKFIMDVYDYIHTNKIKNTYSYGVFKKLFKICFQCC